MSVQLRLSSHPLTTFLLRGFLDLVSLLEYKYYIIYNMCYDRLFSTASLHLGGNLSVVCLLISLAVFDIL